MEKFKVSVKLNCTAKEVFTGWLNDETHSRFTGGAKASISPVEGGAFSAWDGYISGTNVEIFPYKKIIQNWRTSDFSAEDKDSRLEILFTFKDNYTLVTLSHTNIPEGLGEKFRNGWKDRYFSHMKSLFSKKAG